MNETNSFPSASFIQTIYYTLIEREITTDIYYHAQVTVVSQQMNEVYLFFNMYTEDVIHRIFPLPPKMSQCRPLGYRKMILL